MCVVGMVSEVYPMTKAERRAAGDGLEELLLAVKVAVILEHDAYVKDDAARVRCYQADLRRYHKAFTKFVDGLVRG